MVGARERKKCTPRLQALCLISQFSGDLVQIKIVRPIFGHILVRLNETHVVEDSARVYRIVVVSRRRDARLNVRGIHNTVAQASNGLSLCIFLLLVLWFDLELV